MFKKGKFVGNITFSFHSQNNSWQFLATIATVILQLGVIGLLFKTNGIYCIIKVSKTSANGPLLATLCSGFSKHPVKLEWTKTSTPSNYLEIRYNKNNRRLPRQIIQWTNYVLFMKINK